MADDQTVLQASCFRMPKTSQKCELHIEWTIDPGRPGTAAIVSGVATAISQPSARSLAAVGSSGGPHVGTSVTSIPACRQTGIVWSISVFAPPIAPGQPK